MSSDPHKSVVFILSNADDIELARPVGTGFLIHVPHSDPDMRAVYVVTCSHVVEQTPKAGIRFALKGGGTRDVLVDRWYHHDTEDVAVADFEDLDDYLFAAFPIEQGLSESSPQQPSLGMAVTYTGLLGLVPSMSSALIPMVKGGTIGALYQSGVPMKRPSGGTRYVRGHLLDCHSISGFSGSPVMVGFSRYVGETTSKLKLEIPNQFFYLMGMVGGHFDVRQSVEFADSGTLNVPVAAGVGVVYPFEVILEALYHPELVEMRKRE